ncbi:MAG: hypothetical protein QY322_03975 [bacterium]|nr:MAG: hypothetical protein QY322_03975 [bacterium]
MLVRRQILIEEKQALDLADLAMLQGISMSEMHRKILETGIEIQKKSVKGKHVKKVSGADFMIQQAKKAVAGPGNSEYDKYAYDL